MKMESGHPCVLAFETSTAHASLAVWKEGQVLFQGEFLSERSHNSQIFAPLQKALEAHRSEISRIVVGTGPGSYAGVRISLSAAIGLSLFLDVPVIGLASLGALGQPGEYLVTGDARRGTWYVAEVSQGRLQAAPWLGSATGAQERILQHGGLVFTTDVASPPFCAALVARPQSVHLAALAASLPWEAFVDESQRPLEPIYLAPPFITMPKPRNVPLS
jgi:tRNA threonylcarbamoyl adenosine modification protein YeaZ